MTDTNQELSVGLAPMPPGLGIESERGCNLCDGVVDRELQAFRPSSEVCLGCLSETERRQLERDLEMALEVNQSFLPERLPGPSAWDIGFYYRPSRLLSGDFLDVSPRSAGRPGELAVTIGDVAGKGVSAGLLRATLQATLRAVGEQSASPASVLDKANQHFYRVTSPGRFASVFYALLDRDSGAFVYANGGHLPPLLRRASGSWETLDATGMVLGAFDTARYTESAYSLEPGDLLVLYTDGVTEEVDASGDYFDAVRLVDTVDRFTPAPALELARKVGTVLEDFSAGAPSDDRTLLILQR